MLLLLWCRRSIFSKTLQKSTALNYVGFIEGDVLLNGKADVIVSDGFAGNVALKTLEGAVRNLLSLFKDKANSRFIKLILAWIFSLCI